MPQLNRPSSSKIWYPFSQHHNIDEPITIARAEGVYLYDNDGKAYLDLISSWWTNIHGHCHPLIAETISRQAKKLDHVIFANFNHQPAVELAEMLCSCMTDNLQHVFFSDNGSTAVEVALKMAYQYWCNLSENERTCDLDRQSTHTSDGDNLHSLKNSPKNPKRCEFISLEGNYHGDTIGSMSLGGKSGFFNLFADLLIPVNFLPFPAIIDDKELQNKNEQNAIKQAIDLLQRKQDQIAAIIVEPLVQGASGMRMCRPEFMNELLSLCRAEGILLIFDEVMTGFGRTGELFAYRHLAIEPDIICLAKGISGGFLPLAVTVASKKIFNAFLGNDFIKALAHGHSYTANPISCAAAVTSLGMLLQKDTENKIAQIGNWQSEMMVELKGKLDVTAPGLIGNTRQLGTIIAFEVNFDLLSYDNHSPGADQKYQSRISNSLKKSFLDKGLVIRPLANVIYLMPPYCIKKDELSEAYDSIYDVMMSFYQKK